VLYPHPALATAASPRPVDANMRGIGERLLVAARTAKAYGLAAAHIGEPAPVIVINMATAATPAYRLFFNPELVASAVETASGAEASVSLPGIEVSIDRPIWVEIAFDDAEGRRDRLQLEGFVARCALHEVEQMQGRFFLANPSRVKRDMVLRKFAKRRAG
jgi:peptide deformylase